MQEASSRLRKENCVNESDREANNNSNFVSIVAMYLAIIILLRPELVKVRGTTGKASSFVDVDITNLTRRVQNVDRGGATKSRVDLQSDIIRVDGMCISDTSDQLGLHNLGTPPIDSRTLCDGSAVVSYESGL